MSLHNNIDYRQNRPWSNLVTRLVLEQFIIDHAVTDHVVSKMVGFTKKMVGYVNFQSVYWYFEW